MRNNFKGLSGWKKSSFVDYPGTVSAVLFFSGCNLRCPYCHNASLITDPQDISSESDMIWEFLLKRKKLLDGIVITGGEPTLHSEIPSLIADLRTLGYRIKLDSNGLLPEKIIKCSPDYLALDIKTDLLLYSSLLQSKYPDTSERLLQSLAIVKNMKNNAEVRITVAPKIFSPKIAKNLCDILYGVELVYLQKVNLRKDILNQLFFEPCVDTTMQDMKDIQEIISTSVGSCIIRNQ